MAGLSGCWDATAVPEPNVVNDALAERVSYRGAVRHSAKAAPGVALSLTAPPDDRRPGFAVTPECVVTFDGYLSERGSLAAALQLPSSTTSALLIATLVTRHGLPALARLSGHFAFAIAWMTRPRIVLGRDALGLRPLFVARTGRVLAWSSSAKALADVVVQSRRIDDEFIADYFSGQHQSVRSPFHGVVALEPGTLHDVSEQKIHIRREWHVTTPENGHVGNAEEYVDRLSDAVATVTDETCGPIRAELSGGIDSSSIVCLADRLYQQARLRRRVETISHRFDRSPSSDEGKWIDEVEKFRGVSGRHVRESDGWVFEDAERAAFDDQPSPMLCYGGLTRQYLPFVSAHNGSILLSGVGGDQVTLGDRQEPFELADLVGHGDMSTLLAALPVWSRTLQRSGVSLAAEAVGLNISPRLTWKLFRRSVQTRAPWLDVRFVRRHHLERRISAWAWGDERRLKPSLRYRLRIIRDAAAQALLFDVRGGTNYLDSRYPFLEPRFVDWTLTLPFRVMTRPDNQRALVRRELAGVIPDLVRLRPYKRGPNEAVLRASVTRWDFLCDHAKDAEIVRRGYVHATAWADTLHRVRHGAEKELYWFTKTMGLEMWLRHLDRLPDKARSLDADDAMSFMVGSPQ